ncbi:MAG: hypothetical protein CMJ83_04235, partial [Planctomycetes bacterium]|nr:hypothetical protein [Planctomycetota bacterium]
MLVGMRHWIDLLNAQQNWVTDESMLDVIPADAREFDSGPEWPRAKVLAYLHNNVGAIRLNYQRLETGEMLDTDLLNPILEGLTLRLADWRRRPDWRELAAERQQRG